MMPQRQACNEEAHPYETSTIMQLVICNSFSEPQYWQNAPASIVVRRRLTNKASLREIGAAAAMVGDALAAKAHRALKSVHKRQYLLSRAINVYLHLATLCLQL